MSKQEESRDLSFVLLENGLDFIASGLRYIARGETKSDLKYGVLHLASGIELVLKERLRQEDWRLVFVKPDKAEAAKIRDPPGERRAGRSKVDKSRWRSDTKQAVAPQGRRTSEPRKRLRF